MFAGISTCCKFSKNNEVINRFSSGMDKIPILIKKIELIDFFDLNQFFFSFLLIFIDFNCFLLFFIDYYINIYE